MYPHASARTRSIPRPLAALLLLALLAGILGAGGLSALAPRAQAATATATATAAAATPVPADASGPVGTTPTPKTLPPAQIDCKITEWGHVGWYLCNTRTSKITWSGSDTEIFVIGLNHQVYRISKTSNGWHSMGGQAKDWVNAFRNGDGHATVQTIGTNGAKYCSTYTGSTWSTTWYTCSAAAIAARQIGKHCQNFTPCDPTEWCADFATWVWKSAGYNTTGLGSGAILFYHYGKHLTSPSPDDAVVFDVKSSTFAGHVALVYAVGPKTFTEIGGNQGGGLGVVSKHIGLLKKIGTTTHQDGKIYAYIAPRIAWSAQAV